MQTRWAESAIGGNLEITMTFSQKFVGLVQYLAHFLPDVSSYTGPLSAMSKNGCIFHSPGDPVGVHMESCWSPPVVHPLLVQSIPSLSLVLIHSSPPPCGVHKESTWRISRCTNHKDYRWTSWGLHQDLERSPCPVLMKSLSTPVLIQVESTLSPHERFSDETLSGLHQDSTRTPPRHDVRITFHKYFMKTLSGQEVYYCYCKTYFM